MPEAGDINGDGYNDLLCGDSRVMDGVVDLYLGGTELDTDFDMSVYRGDLPNLLLERIGYRLSPAGDFNADGIDDFMFACQNMWFGDPGDVFVVAGSRDITTGISGNGSVPLPDGFQLRQNYPNPFNAGTRIVFVLDRRARVNLVIYNVLGQMVATLVTEKDYSAGEHIVTWNGTIDDGTKASSGIYFYELQSVDKKSMRKMVILK